MMVKLSATGSALACAVRPLTAAVTGVVANLLRKLKIHLFHSHAYLKRRVHEVTE